MRFFTRYILIALFLWPAPAHATPCLNPPGDEGDQVYNITYHVMQYCNGQHWVAMGSVMGQGDNLGDHTAGQALDMSGFRIQNLAPPTASTDAATMAYADTKVSKAGDTMTGALNLSGAPTANPHAANKEYVDMVVASASGGSSNPMCIPITRIQNNSCVACPAGYTQLWQTSGATPQYNISLGNHTLNVANINGTDWSFALKSEVVSSSYLVSVLLYNTYGAGYEAGSSQYYAYDSNVTFCARICCQT